MDSKLQLRLELILVFIGMKASNNPYGKIHMEIDMLIASADYYRDGWSSPSDDLSSNVQSCCTIAGKVADVKNEPIHFDTRPSRCKSVKRALISVFQRIISVFQAIPRAFVSLLPCCGRSVGSTPSTAVRCETQESSATSNTPHLPKQHPTVCSESRKFDDRSSSFKKFRAMLDNDEIDWDWWESKTVEGPTNLISPEEVTMSTVQVYMAETEQTNVQKLKGNHERDSHNDDELIYKYHPEKTMLIAM